MASAGSTHGRDGSGRGCALVGQACWGQEGNLERGRSDGEDVALAPCLVGLHLALLTETNFTPFKSHHLQ